MKSYIIDIEGDSLTPTKIHCISYCNEDGTGLKSITSRKEMREFVKSADRFIGHNIIAFDIPVLERLLKVKIKAELYDTLSMSWYLEPDRHRHNLDNWGEELGVAKPKITSWTDLPIEEYVHRCEEDVKITHLLYSKFSKKLRRIYENERDIGRIWSYLSFKLTCIAIQSKNGWKLDKERAEKLFEHLDEQLSDKYNELIPAMPKVPVVAIRQRPAAPFKKDGTHSVAGARWFSLLNKKGLPENYTGTIRETTSYAEANPNSPAQVKDWLTSLGWKPCTFRVLRDKETGDVRKIPQIYDEMTKELTPSVVKLAKKEPAVLILESLSVLKHRRAIAEGFLKSVDEDGYVRATAHGLTNTLRLKHSAPIVNLPKVTKPYGEDIRGCLIASEGYVLGGSDMSSLEDRTKQHYMYEYDPEFVEEMNVPGFDPHLDLAVMAGMLTKEQADNHKKGIEHHDEIRHGAKTGNYACTYGAGAKRIAMAANIPLKMAEKIHEGYWKRNWSLIEISENCIVKTVDKRKWLYNPVSKFWYSLRSDKDRFSTLNQGTADYCFTTWLRAVMRHTKMLLGQFHDEHIFLVPEGGEEEHSKILLDAIKKINTKLKLNRDLDIDIKFGKRYSEIH